jgi:hypothetical protein
METENNISTVFVIPVTVIKTLRNRVVTQYTTLLNGQHYGNTRRFYARSQNCEKRLLVSSCLSICPSVRPCVCVCMSVIFVKFDIRVIFREPTQNVQVSLKSDKNKGYFT